MMSATARCFASIASKEISCAVSVNAKIVPLSSVGMKPFGMTRKKYAVKANVRSNATIVVRRWLSVHCSVLS